MVLRRFAAAPQPTLGRVAAYDGDEIAAARIPIRAQATGKPTRVNAGIRPQRDGHDRRVSGMLVPLTLPKEERFHEGVGATLLSAGLASTSQTGGP